MKDFAPEPLAGVRLTDRLVGLDAIHAPDCAAVICAQPEAASLCDWLTGLSPDLLPRTRQILRPDAIAAVLPDICATLPDAPERQRLGAFIAALAAQFAVVMNAPWLRLRLEIVTGNACRKFHIDNVTARLVCTLRGTGTQIGLAERGAEPAIIQTVAAGHPLVLRGMRWPTTPCSLLKHRSPPIAGSGETRLLLVLDPLDSPEDEV
ncbi:MAG: DUF1826 domain-containing protein [Roseinatronobacter sp.]